jgi:transketolase
LNGHDIEALCDAIAGAKACKTKPSIIIADTIKGKGISFMEGKNTWHGKAIDDKSFETAMTELKGGALNG